MQISQTQSRRKKNPEWMMILCKGWFSTFCGTKSMIHGSGNDDRDILSLKQMPLVYDINNLWLIASKARPNLGAPPDVLAILDFTLCNDASHWLSISSFTTYTARGEEGGEKRRLAIAALKLRPELMSASVSQTAALTRVKRYVGQWISDTTRGVISADHLCQ